MNKGKKICEQLKQIRCDIARNNDIPFETRECQHQGECSGTCPRCEAEVRYLETELVRRNRLAKVAALATGLTLSMSACNIQGEVPMDTDSNNFFEGEPAEKPLEGDVLAPQHNADSVNFEETPSR